MTHVGGLRHNLQNAFMWMPATLGLVALGCLGVAGRGFATNRPFLFTPRWFLAGVTALFWMNFALGVRHAIRASHGGAELDLQTLVLPGLLAFVTLLLLVQLRGFVAVGVTGPLFREALFVSIKKLGLPFEQHFSIVRLPSAGATVRMTVQSWTGTAQIKLTRLRGRRTLRHIARGMNDYFESRKIATSTIACMYYLALGLMFAAMAYQLWPD